VVLFTWEAKAENFFLIQHSGAIFTFRRAWVRNSLDQPTADRASDGLQVGELDSTDVPMLMLLQLVPFGVHRWHLPYCTREGSVDLLPEGFVIQSWNFDTRLTRAASFRSSLTGNASLASGPTLP
jgi:hypothetical protein